MFKGIRVVRLVYIFRERWSREYFLVRNKKRVVRGGKRITRSLLVENGFGNFTRNVEDFFVDRVTERFFYKEKNENYEREYNMRKAGKFNSELILEREKKEVEVFFFRKFRLDEFVIEDVSGVGVTIKSFEDAFKVLYLERIVVKFD